MSSICDSCHAGCCRTYRLLITIYDFLDLVNLLGVDKAVQGLAFEELAYDPNYSSNKSSPFPFVFDNPDRKGKMFHLALKKVESALFPGTYKCHFLAEGRREQKEVNPDLPGHAEHVGSEFYGRCGVYTHRPTMCRTYPIGYNHQNNRSVLSRRKEISEHPALQICPKQNLDLTDFGLNQADAFMKRNDDLLLLHARTLGHNEEVLRWNSLQERPVEKIVPFMLQFGSSMILVQKPKETNQAKPVVPPVNSANPPVVETAGAPR